MDLARDRLFNRLRRTLHFFLQLAQFIQLDLAIDVALHIIDIALHAPQQMPRRARQARQFFRPQHDERDKRDHHHLGKADVKHKWVVNRVGAIVDRTR